MLEESIVQVSFGLTTLSITNLSLSLSLSLSLNLSLCTNIHTHTCVYAPLRSLFFNLTYLYQSIYLIYRMNIIILL